MAEPRATRNEPDAASAMQATLRPLRPMLRDDSPVPFLMHISSMMHHMSAKAGPKEIEKVVDGLIAAPYAESTAALTAITALTTDGALRERIAASLAGRRHMVPVWLRHLSEAMAGSEVCVAANPGMVAGHLLFEVKFAGGKRVTFMVYTVADPPGAVLDAFPVAMPLEPFMVIFAVEA